MNQIFLSPDGSRLRAGWRLFIQTAALLTIGGCISVPIVIILIALDPSFINGIPNLKPEFWLLAAIGETLAVTLSVFLARRFLDKQPIESLGLKLNMQALFDVLAGIGITFVQMGLIFLVMLGLDWLTFTGFAWEFDPVGLVVKNTVLFFIIFILVGWNEELLSRGYHLQTIASGLNLFWGVVISSAVFGLLHFGNPNATWVSVTGIFFAGVLFAYAYIRRRQLWLPMGLHLGWNFFEGVVFGFPVSGLDIYPLTRIEVMGPILWTGGAFGPEAGLIVLPALILGALLIYLYTTKRHD
ncbi:MAG TPA: type II CAAX endopeptidase family protein [Anaerolineales bacterium]|nr:type II CAAX endopeptidase family protein [Anaerolineales bacterium]